MMTKSMAASMAKRTDAYRARMSAWRSEPAISRAEGPINPARARSLGYKAKKEFIIVRVRISKGRRIRRKAKLGRKSGGNQKRVSPAYSKQWLATSRASRRYINMRPLGCYFVGSDGNSEYFEVILCLKQSSTPFLRQPAATATKTVRAKAAK